MTDRVSLGKSITERLRDEAKWATRSWTLVEAFNGKDESHRDALRKSLEKAGLGVTIHTLLSSLIRETLASLFRVSDDAGGKGERQTFCALIPLLTDISVTTALEEEARFPDFLEKQNVALVRTSIAHLLRCVPARWKDGVPADSSLYDLRARLRPVRDSLLSHALDYSEVQQATFGETRGFLEIVNGLENAASSAFHCRSESLQDRWDAALAHAHRFWDIVESGAKPYA